MITQTEIDKNVATKGSKGGKPPFVVRLKCMECYKEFSMPMEPSIYNVSCPKCKSVDVEIA